MSRKQNESKTNYNIGKKIEDLMLKLQIFVSSYVVLFVVTSRSRYGSSYGCDQGRCTFALFEAASEKKKNANINKFCISSRVHHTKIFIIVSNDQILCNMIK